MNNQDAYHPIYGWSLLAGITLFGVYLLWDFGLIRQLVEHDITYLSSIILVLFAGISAYLGRAAWELSRQNRFASQLSSDPGSDGSDPAKTGWAGEHLSLVRKRRSDTSGETDPLIARLVERVHRGHAVGWFLSDLLVRLGLIGTVIGFVLMLGSVFDAGQNDISQLRDLMTTVGGGMRVALYTTLTGLGTALLVSIQCKWLDRCADTLISEIIRLGVEPDDRV